MFLAAVASEPSVTVRLVSDADRTPHYSLTCGPARSAPGPVPRSVFARLQWDPETPITLVEGCCEICNCCDGFSPTTKRCVHGGGLIRDYKKDLDVLQKLGLAPGATMPARDLIRLMFERIPSTRDICAYGDGVARSAEWSICGDPKGSAGYARSREKGML